MARHKRQLRIKVRGVRRRTPDSRRIARAIVRLAIEEGTDRAQDLADRLEHDETLHRQAVTRQRHADRDQGSVGS